jgi:hypothetical protein
MSEIKEKVVTIIVNGREKEVDEKKISFEEIIEIAFGQVEQNPNVVYTVKYSLGKNEDKGSLVEGETIKVKKGMVINATKTDKS